MSNDLNIPATGQQMHSALPLVIPTRLWPINWHFLRTICFPHWVLWAVPSVLLLLLIVVAATSTRIQFADQSFATNFLYLLATAVLVLCRYVRFQSFDWFLHRLWMLALMYIWIGYALGNLGLFSSVLFANKLPMIDGTLLAIDRHLGFDWNAYAHLLVDSPALNSFFSFVYARMTFDALLVTIVVAMFRNDQSRVVETCYLMVACGMTSTTIAAFLPSIPTFDTLADSALVAAMKTQGVYFSGQVLERLTALRDAPIVIIDPQKFVGVVTFPSFHCCMALIIMRCNRGIRLISPLATLLGIAIIIGTPVYGGHYIVDLIGGATIMAFYVWLWQAYFSKRLHGLLPVTPEQSFRVPAWLKRFRKTLGGPAGEASGNQ